MEHDAPWYGYLLLFVYSFPLLILGIGLVAFALYAVFVLVIVPLQRIANKPSSFSSTPKTKGRRNRP